MVKHSFDANQPYRVVIYLRLSSDKQNKHPPDQQLAKIKKWLKKLGYTWVIVKVYRDDANSGRLFRKRPQFQQMQDLRSGAGAANLILVDTLERFGRLAALPAFRKAFDKFGILVLAADTHFTNPTTTMGVCEALRATDNVDQRPE